MFKTHSTRILQKKLFWVFTALTLAALACNLPEFGADAGESQVIPGPEVAFQEPVPGKRIAVGDSFAVFVTANDPLGVVRLDLWVDDVLVLSQPVPEAEAGGVTPLILSNGLMGTQPGTYSLVARAYNSLGALGESLALHVTVSTEQSAAQGPEQVLYIVQQGNTIESVAQATGSSASAIQAANPGVGNPPNPGEAVVLPGAHSVQPPAQPAQPPAQPGGAGPGGQVFPGLLPIQPGGAGVLPGFPAGQGNVAQIAPNLFPGFQPVRNITNSGLAAPDMLTLSTADCKVTLNWKDSSTSETGFTIYRRLKPDQLSPQYVVTVPADQTSYVDDVPHPGTYEYAVEATGKIEVLPSDQVDQVIVQNNMLSTSRSSPVYVEVQPTAACIQDPDRVKYIHIQPSNVTPKHGGAGFAALWYSINNSPGRRVPGAQGQYSPTGAWSVPDAVVPVAGSFFLNPDQHIIAKFWASATTLDFWSDPRGPTNLGEAYNAINPADITKAKGGGYYIAQNDNFEVGYSISLEEMKWTGQGTTTKIPTPTNLRVKRTTTNSRVITWDWNGDANTIDGYILYKSYSCPGMDTQIYAPKMIPAAQKESEITFKSEPTGCLYRYEVSAYGREGETGRSNKLEGDTEAAYAIAGITFKTLKINDIPYGPSGVQLKLYANQHRRVSDVYWVQEASYALNAWNLDGRRPHNALSMALAEKEFLTIGFSISGVDNRGYMAQDSVCTGASIIPPVNAWKQTPWTVIIKSTDGSCELTIELSGQKPTATSSGGVVFPQADIAITKVERIGNKVFAYIENNGPDDLPNNRIGFYVAWYKILPSGYTQVTGHQYKHDFWVQSNLPQWVHLDNALDKFLISECNLSGGASLSDCSYILYIPIWPYGTDQDSNTPNFTDPNTDQFYEPFDKIGIMK